MSKFTAYLDSWQKVNKRTVTHMEQKVAWIDASNYSTIDFGHNVALVNKIEVSGIGGNAAVIKDARSYQFIIRQDAILEDICVFFQDKMLFTTEQGIAPGFNMRIEYTELTTTMQGT